VKLWVDLETLPAVMKPDELDAYVRRRVPKNMSKPETIDAWVADNKTRLWRETALRPLRGQVLCIAIAADDDDVISWYDPDPSTGSVLRSVEDYLTSLAPRLRAQQPTWCGWHVEFDVGYLRLHGARLGLRRLVTSLPVKPWDSVDVRALLTGSRSHVRGYSLASVASFFGLEKGQGLHGGEVLDAWARGEHERIERYCCDDVSLTRELGRRLGVR
jgi:hypothetical protein